MEDKRLRERFKNSSNQQLTFTKEDRNAVFEEIRKQDKDSQTQKIHVSPKKFVPLTVSLLVVGLCLILFLPSIFSGNFIEESNRSDLNQETNIGVAADSNALEAEFSTSLITVKSKEMENRIYLNLLLTYNKDKEMMNVVSLPNDTYAPVSDNEDGTTLYDKLLFAYQFGGAENVKRTVSKFLNIPIDYYAVIDLETFSELMDSMNGIEYDLPEDIRLRAVSQVAFEFKKGANHLNAEQIVSLMMAATDGVNLDDENLVNLMNAVMKKTEDEILKGKLKELFTQIEANTTLDHLVDTPMAINSINSLPLSDGMISDLIPLSSTTGKHIYRFEEDYLNTVKQELTTFN